MKNPQTPSCRLNPAVAFALAAFAGLSAASAQDQVFFEDFSTVANGTLLNGLQPTAGGPIVVSTDGSTPLQVTNASGTNGYVETQGAARVFDTPFTSTLGADQTLIITVDFGQTTGDFFSGGFAGFKLEAGGNQVGFFGDSSDDTTGFDLASSNAGGAVEVKTGVTTLPSTATLTYSYNTGLTTLTIGTTEVYLTLAADLQINDLQFENNGGGDARFSSIAASVASGATTSVVWTGAANSTWDTSTVNFDDGTTAIPRAYNDSVLNGTGDNVTFDDTAAGSHTINIPAAVHPNSVTVNTASNYTINALAGSGGIAGIATITLLGGGTLNLTGTNGYTGLTAVQSGSLSISSGAALGETSTVVLGYDYGTPGSSGNLIDNGTTADTLAASLITAGGSTATDSITISNLGANLIFSGPLTGTAPLIKNGPGELTLSGSISGFAQPITVNAGTLSLGSAQPGVVTISSASAVLDYSGSGTGPGSINAASTALLTASNPTAQLVLTGQNTIGGALTFSGPGHVTLAGPTSIGGALTVNGGTFTLSNTGNTLQSGPIVNAGGVFEYMVGALGTGATDAVTLNGGTLALRFGGAGLTGNYFNNTPNDNTTTNTDPDLASLASYNSHIAALGTPAVTAPTSTGGQMSLNFSNAGFGMGAAFASQGFSSNVNLEAQFIGYIYIPTTGVYTFSTTSDDGSILGIDGNLVANNNVFQGATNRGGSISLTAGAHQIEIGYYQGTGGMGLEAFYSGPGVVNQIIPNSALSSSLTFNETTAVTVSGSSTIDPEGSIATLGSISLNAGASLEVKEGSLSSQATSFQTSGGTGAFTVTVDSGGVLNPGLLSTTNPTDTVNLHLEGAGSLVLIGASGPINNLGTVLDLGGTGLNTLVLVEQSSIGNASVNFSGGGLAITTNNPSAPMTLSVPYTYNGDGFITAGAAGFGQSGGTLDIVSPTVPSGRTLYLGSTDGYTLNLNGAPTGGGNIGVSAGPINIGPVGAGSAIDGLGLIFVPAAGVTATANINANTASLTSLTAATAGTANLVIGTGTGNPVLNLNNAAANTFNGNITAAAGSANPTLNKSGAGMLTLSGNSSLAAVNVGNGGLTLTSPTAAGSANINLANGTSLALATPGISTQSLSNPTLSGFANDQANGTNAANAIDPSNSFITLTVNATGGGEGTSVFSKAQYATTNGFIAQFVYTAGGNKAADGTAFVVQSEAPTALGQSGGALAYAGITNGGAFEINLYSNNTIGTAASVNAGPGTTGGYVSANPVNPASGDPIQVTLTYDGVSTLTETLVDQTTQQVYTNTFTNFNLNGALNGDQGYVGFTGGDGGLVSTQTVSGFLFSNIPTTTYANTLSLSSNAVASVQSNGLSAVAGLAMGANSTLNLVPVGNALANTTYNLTVEGTTTLNGADTINIANNGTGIGMVTLNAVGEASPGSSLTVNGPGILLIAGAATYTGATNIAGGTLAVGVSGSISGSKNINVAGSAFFNVSAQTGGYTVPAGQTLSLASGGTVTGNLNVSGGVAGLGTIHGNVTVNSGGGLTPGNLGGLLTLNGSFTSNAGGALNIELGGIGESDVLVVSGGGGISLDGPLTGSLFDGYHPAQGDLFYIAIGSATPVVGFFSNQSAAVDANGFNTVNVAGTTFEVSYDASYTLQSFSGGGNDIALQAVPEPSSLFSLFGAGALFTGLGRFRRRS